MNTNENGNQQIEIIKQQVDEFVVDLLHVNEIKKNKLVDLTSGDVSNTYYLTHSLISNLRKYLLDIVKDRIGKPGNTVLRGSSLVPGKEQIIGKGINDFDWVSGSGEKNPKAFIK